MKLKLEKSHNNLFPNNLVRIVKLQQLQKEVIQSLLKKKLQHQKQQARLDQKNSNMYHLLQPSSLDACHFSHKGFRSKNKINNSTNI